MIFIGESGWVLYLKFAIVRCGRIAKRHSDLLAENQIDGAELIAVADKKFDRTELLVKLKMLTLMTICMK